MFPKLREIGEQVLSGLMTAALSVAVTTVERSIE